MIAVCAFFVAVTVRAHNTKNKFRFHHDADLYKAIACLFVQMQSLAFVRTQAIVFVNVPLVQQLLRWPICIDSSIFNL
jgi:hypothetical protein